MFQESIKISGWSAVKTNIEFTTILRIRGEGGTYGLFMDDGRLSPLSIPLSFPEEVSSVIRTRVGADAGSSPENKHEAIHGSLWVSEAKLSELRVMFAQWAFQCKPFQAIVEALAERLGATAEEMRRGIHVEKPCAYSFDPYANVPDVTYMRCAVIRPFQASRAVRGALAEAETRGTFAWVYGREILARYTQGAREIDYRARWVL